MRRARSGASGDLDEIDVLVEEREDEVPDAFLMLLQELAREAVERRATSPGDPHREPDAHTDPTLGPTRGFWARRRLRWAVVAVVALTVLVTPNVLERRQDAAQAAALAALPTVLDDASRPPGEAWRVPGRMVAGVWDAVLVVAPGEQVVQRLDPATGEEVWASSSAVAAVAADGRCFTVDDAVACVAEQRAVRGPGGTTAQVRVALVDLVTGATTLETAAPGALVLADTVGGDLLLAIASADGRLHANRWDADTGAVLWEYRSAGRVLAADASTGHDVERRPDSLTVGSVALDLRTGEELDVTAERRAPLWHEEHVLAGGVTVTWAWDADGDSGTGHVTRGGRRVDVLRGPPLVPVITDGSHGQTLVTASADGVRLRATDLRTGRVLWSGTSVGGVRPRATVQVDGVLLLDGGGAVAAVDLRTGEQRWSASVASGVTSASALTDGEVVVLPTTAGDGAVWMVARRLADGTQAWLAPAPERTLGLVVVDRRLVALTREGAVGLSWAAG